MNPRDTIKGGRSFCALLALAVAAVMLAPAGDTKAASISVADNNWTTAVSWNGGVPHSNSTAWIGGGHTITYNAGGRTVRYLRIGHALGTNTAHHGAGTLLITGNTLTIRSDGNMYIGEDGQNGTVKHTGGTLACHGGFQWGFSAGAVTHYYLGTDAAGADSAGALNVGFSATNRAITDGAGTSHFYLGGGTMSKTGLTNVAVDYFYHRGTAAGTTFTWGGGPGGTWTVKTNWLQADLAGKSATFLMNDGNRDATAQNGIDFGAGDGRFEIDADGAVLRVIAGGISDGAGTSTINVDGGTLDVEGNADVVVDNFGMRNGGNLTTADLGHVTVNNDFDFQGMVPDPENGGEIQYGRQINWLNAGKVFWIKGNLSMADTAGQVATFRLTAGTLDIDGSILNGAGYGGLALDGGTLAYTGTIDVDYFAVGNWDNAAGATYALSNDITATDAMYVGRDGTGSFTQQGGATVTVANNAYVGSGATGRGEYNISGGSLVVTKRLILGSATGSMGSFNLSGSGYVNAQAEYVGIDGTGVFTQTGGTNVALGLFIGPQGTYDLQGGVFQKGSIANEGVFDFNGAAGTIDVGDDSIVDLTGAMDGSANATFLQGSNSLLLIAPGGTPWDDFDAFSSSAITHEVGGDLTLGAGSGFGGMGSIPDHLTTAGGDIIATVGGFIELGAGLTQVGGTVNLRDGTLIVNDMISGISGNGELTLHTLKVGSGGTGRFNHASGNVTITGTTTYVLGEFVGDSGEYLLSAGTLSDAVAYVGQGGEGLFTHTGGTFSASGGVDIGLEATGSGSYLLSGANSLLDVTGVMDVGDAGAGYFRQTAGTVRMSGTGNLRIGYAAGGVGHYVLSGGLIDVTAAGLDLNVANNGVGTLDHTGGTIKVDDELRVAFESGTGTYNLSGTGRVEVGGRLLVGRLGSGIVNQAGGVVVVTNDIEVGRGTNGYGAYNHTGGTATAGGLLVGDTATSIGSYVLDGGALTIDDGGTPGATNWPIAGSGLLIFDSGSFNIVSGTIAAPQFDMARGATDNVSMTIASAGRLETTGDINVGNHGTGAITSTGGVIQAGGFVRVGHYGTGTVTQTLGTTTVGQLKIANRGAASSGVYTLSGGQLTVTGAHLVVGDMGDGTLTLTDATVTAGDDLEIGYQATGSGAVTQTRGSVTVTDQLRIGGVDGAGVGTYTIQGTGATLTMNEMRLGDMGTGLFIQHPDTTVTADDTRLGIQLTYGYPDGVYIMSGGVYDNTGTLGPIYIGYRGRGYFHQMAGTVRTTTEAYASTRDLRLAVHDTGAQGTYIIDGGLLLIDGNVRVGDMGTGLFIQNGGTVDNDPGGTDGFIIADDRASNTRGEYIMSAGLLVTALDMCIGYGTGAVGSFTQHGGEVQINGASSHLRLAQVANSTGTYTISGGTLTVGGQIRLSDDPISSSTFNQDGGEVTVGGNVHVGIDDDATWNMTAGTLSINGPHYLNVGWGNSGAVGIFNQSGGSVFVTGDNVAQAELIVGYQAAGGGATYNLSGDDSILDVAYNAVVGRASPGVFNQTGGSFGLGYAGGGGTGNLTLGELAGGSGEYKLAGGILDINGNLLGGAGDSTFIYNGGALSVGGGTIAVDTFTMAENAGDNVSLTLTGSRTDVGAMFVGGAGTAAYTQSSGTFRAGYVCVGEHGKLTVGGPMDIWGGFDVKGGAGTFDRDGSPYDMTTDSVLFDLGSGGTVLNAGGMAVTVGANSLVLYDSADDLRDAFGVFDDSGAAKVHAVGSTLVINGETIVGWGEIDDPVDMQSGSITATPDGWIHYTGGYTQSGGTSDIGSGDLIIDSVVSFTPGSLSGGLLTVGGAYIALGGNGLFTQSGGTLNVNDTASFTVGRDAGGVGTYLLSGGELNQAGSVVIGDAGDGVFIQTGGEHNATGDGLVLAGQATGSGVYRMSAGDLNIDGAQMFVGLNGTGRFVQTGGKVTLTSDNPVVGAEGVGTYELSGGLLETGSGYVLTAGRGNGAPGEGLFVHTGGTVRVGWMVVGNYDDGVGTYRMTGGLLETSHDNGIRVGGGAANRAGTGVFILSSGYVDVSADISIGYAGTGSGVQYGGTIVTGTGGSTGQFYVGTNEGSTGTYELVDGLIQTDKGGLRVGWDGQGLFTQRGGTVNVGVVPARHTFTIGQNSTGIGTYEMFDGLLSVTSNVNVANHGKGVFIQHGGTVTHVGDTADRDLFIGKNAGGVGEYVMSGGLLSSTRAIKIGYNNNSLGAFNQLGGSVTSGSQMTLAFFNSEGTYNLSGSDSVLTVASGHLDVGREGVGVFNQSDGKVIVAAGDLILGNHITSNGKYNMMGGSLSVNNNIRIADYATGVGLFEQTGGTVTVGGDVMMPWVAGSTGTYNITNADSLLTVGGDLAANAATGSGVFNLNSGTVVVNGSVWLGGRPFELNVKGGLLDAATMIVGNNAPRSWQAEGGELHIGHLIVGNDVNGGGTFTQTSAAPLTAETITIVRGGSGAATFDWESGELTVGTLNVNTSGLFLDTKNVDLSLDVLAVDGGLVDLGDNKLTHSGAGGFVQAAGGTVAGRVDLGTLEVPVGGSFEVRGGGTLAFHSEALTIGGETGAAATFTLGDAGAGAGEIIEAGDSVDVVVNPTGVFRGWSRDSGGSYLGLTGTFTNKGRVIADSFGEAGRSLDLTGFAAIAAPQENPPDGVAGWYAQDKGKLVLPGFSVSGAGTYKWGEPADDPGRVDLVNSAELVFAGSPSGFDVDISLLADDHDDTPALGAGLAGVGAAFVGVWEIVDTSEGDFDLSTESWTLTIRYDEELLSELLIGSAFTQDELLLYFYDSDAGVWLPVENWQPPDTDLMLISGDGAGEGYYALIIPEPATLTLLALGGLAALCRRRKRRPGKRSMRTAMLLALIGAVGLSSGIVHADWAQQAKLLADDGLASDFFGGSVSIDGDYAVVGAYGDDLYSGSAYIFHRTGLAWTQQAKVRADDAAAEYRFGRSVSISGDYAVIGSAGGAYIFQRTGSSWTQQTKLTTVHGQPGDWFGDSVSISGEYAVVGAWNDDDNGDESGAAYMFKRTGSLWTWQDKETADDAAERDRFGVSVSISGDYAAVGAWWDDDNAHNSGSVYIFKRTSTLWFQQAKLTADDGGISDYFGKSVSIDGDYVVVGAYADDDNGNSSGSAYVFQRTDSTWTQQAKLLPDDGASDDYFGKSVAVSGDCAVVAAAGDDDRGYGSGSAYIFQRTGSTWTQTDKLTAYDTAAGDAFGHAVAVSGDYAVVGAHLDDDNGDKSGAAFVFVVPEPASAMLLMIGSVLLVRRRRRK